MEFKGKHVEIYLSTPLILRTVRHDPMIIKGKVLEQAGGGFWIEIEQSGSTADAKIPFKHIFVPTSKIDFIGLV